MWFRSCIEYQTNPLRSRQTLRCRPSGFTTRLAQSSSWAPPRSRTANRLERCDGMVRWCAGGGGSGGAWRPLVRRGSVRFQYQSVCLSRHAKKVCVVCARSFARTALYINSIESIVHGANLFIYRSVVGCANCVVARRVVDTKIARSAFEYKSWEDADTKRRRESSVCLWRFI